MKNLKNMSIGGAAALLLSQCTTQLDVTTIPQNEPVIRAVEKMPTRGGYATGVRANRSLSRSMRVDGEDLVTRPSKAKPSYCSGATYHVLLEMVKTAEKRGEVELSQSEAQALMVAGQADGVGVWGRWNANGPGAAKLVHDLNMGENFESYERAQPGDFMKIFWTDEIGKHEFGHLVVYLGLQEHEGQDYVTFWSSNQPLGYGVRAVPKTAVKWAIFTRITNIAGIKGVDDLAPHDPFLSSMLTRSYSRASVRRKCGIR